MNQQPPSTGAFADRENLAKSLSERAFAEAQEYIPGGVNSPVRAFNAVGGVPVFIERAIGSKLYDIDGNAYIDYISAWGPMILGHAHPAVISTISRVLERGLGFGTPTLLETEVAKLIVGALPSVEKVRMVNSGTEAAMSAIRLARGVTGREKIIKFEGCYHGHGDSFLIAAGSGAITTGVPDSAGVTRGTASNTLMASYNDLSGVAALFEANRGVVAGVIVEPVAGNMGTIPGRADFLKGLRELAHEHGALLIFDEVMTGFRLAWGSAQVSYGIEPDITCLGKIIGGGLPVGAYGGRREWMDAVSPLGGVYQAGTLSGNPLAMACGHATLSYLQEHAGSYAVLEEKGSFFEAGLRELLLKHQVLGVINRVGSMLTLFFTDSERVENFTDVKKSDSKKYAIFFQHLLSAGIYFPPSAYEAIFFSLAHTKEDLEMTLGVIDGALREVKKFSR